MTEWRRKALTAITLAAIVALGAWLRFYRLGERSFWFDEAFFWRLASFPLAEVLKRTAEDNYPPLYPVLLKAWSLAFGDSAWALRSLSALCGSATIIGAYLFCVEAAGGGHASTGDRDSRSTAGAGLLGAALVACGVMQIRWSWDVKMYTLGAMLSVFSSWALLRALRTRQARAWLFYGALAGLFALTHYYALFSVFAQGVFAAVMFLRAAGWSLAAALRDASCRSWLLSLALLLAMFAPWLPTFVRQHHREREAALRPPVTLEKAAETPFGMFCEPEDSRPSGVATLAVLLLSEAVLFALLASPNAASCYTLLAATAPFALGVAVSSADTNIFETRYLVFAQPFWLFAAALAVARLKSPLGRPALGVLLVGSLLVAHGRFWRRCEFPRRPGAKGAAEHLRHARRSTEPVIVCSQLYYYPLLYHSDDATGVLLFDDEDTVRRHAWGSAIIQPRELISRHACDALRSRRIWVVDMVGGWAVPCVPPCAAWKPASRRTFQGTWNYEGDYRVLEYINTSATDDGSD